MNKNKKSLAVTLRFRKGNLNEMKAYEFISKESENRHISKNQLIISAILNASEGQSNDKLVNAIVEGISQKLFQEGAIIGTVIQKDVEVDEFPEEDFNFI